MWKVRSLLAVVAFVAVAGCANLRSDAGTDDVILTLEHDGRTRYALVHVPPDLDRAEPASLVLVLHGGGGNAANAARMSQFSDKADEAGFIVAYPYGTGTFRKRFLTWNAGLQDVYAHEHKIDDVGFMRALVDQLESEYRIDASRIYITGMSNGAMMAYRLGCELSERVAAIAPVAGSMPEDCPRPRHPVSVMIVHGSEDRHIPFEGGVGKDAVKPQNHPSVSSAVAQWVAWNGCEPEPRIETSDHVETTVYSGCKQGTEVVVHKLIGGNHSWPGGRKGWIGGDPPFEHFDATERLWRFFDTHPKQEQPAQNHGERTGSGPIRGRSSR